MTDRQNSWIKVLRQYKRKNISIKILFKYPTLQYPIIRTGNVVKIESDCFSFNDVKIGVAYYAYNYIFEIKEEIEDGRNI